MVDLVSKPSILPTSDTNLTGGTLTFLPAFATSPRHLCPPCSKPSPEVWLCGFHPRTREEVPWREETPVVLWPIAHTVAGGREKDHKVPSVNHLVPSTSLYALHTWPLPYHCFKPLSLLTEGTAKLPQLHLWRSKEVQSKSLGYFGGNLSPGFTVYSVNSVVWIIFLTYLKCGLLKWKQV